MADKDSFDELGKDLEVLVAIWALALFDELMQIKPRTVFHLNEKIEAQIRLVQVTVFHDWMSTVQSAGCGHFWWRLWVLVVWVLLFGVRLIVVRVRISVAFVFLILRNS